MNNEIETIIKSLSIKKKQPGSDRFTAEFQRIMTVKEELTPMLLKLFHKIGRE
jgi:hypothetical protein